MAGLGLLDIAPRIGEVRVGDGEDEVIRVRALSTRTVIDLLGRFPAFERILGGLRPSAEEMRDAGPDFMAAIIAAAVIDPATGKPVANAETLAAAAELSPELQLDLLTEIAQVTFKQGVGPFVRRLVSMLPGASPGAAVEAPVTTSPTPSSSSNGAAIPTS